MVNEFNKLLNGTKQMRIKMRARKCGQHDAGNNIAVKKFGQ